MNMNHTVKISLATVALVVAAFTLSACEEDEQDRVLRYQKGTYLGQQDQPLDEGTLNELRGRARNQEGV